MRECLRAILILQCERHGTGKRRRQRIEAQAAGNNIIIIGDGEKTVFFLVDFPLAKDILRSQTVGGKIRADRLLIREDFGENERFGNLGGIKIIRPKFRLRLDVGKQSIRIDADGGLKVGFRGESVLLE